VSDHYPIELLIESSYETIDPERITPRPHQTTTSSYRIFSSYASSSPHLRVGAFNVRVFGRSKVSNEDVLNILVQVITDALNSLI